MARWWVWGLPNKGTEASPGTSSAEPETTFEKLECGILRLKTKFASDFHKSLTFLRFFLKPLQSGLNATHIDQTPRMTASTSPLDGAFFLAAGNLKASEGLGEAGSKKTGSFPEIHPFVVAAGFICHGK